MAGSVVLGHEERVGTAPEDAEGSVSAEWLRRHSRVAFWVCIASTSFVWFWLSGQPIQESVMIGALINLLLVFIVPGEVQYVTRSADEG